MNESPDPKRSIRPHPPTFPSPPRAIAHAIIAILGWILFGWWWWLVLGRLNHEHVLFTLYFIGVTTVVSVALTGIWSFHNLMIFRRRGARTHVREVAFDFSSDRLGRAVTFTGSRESLERAPVVDIQVEQGTKAYRAAALGGGARSTPGTGSAS